MSYHNLLSYQQATIVYDFTVEFCNLHLAGYEQVRQRQQMTQAGRSGKQNIAEGSRFSRVSSKFEIKLIGTARASLEELLEDYIDYLRQKNMRIWDKNSIEARKIRGLKDRSYKTYKLYMTNPETAANVMICLINQTNYLLDKQIRALEQKFLQHGGYTENLYKSRINYRKKYV